MASNSICLSIVIPVFNACNSLEKCVESILSISIDDYEIILVDDGSTDGSKELCDKLVNYDERIKVYHKKNGGAASARNYGLMKARGEYISFIDSDDYIFPNEYVKVFSDVYSHKYDVGCFDMIMDSKVISSDPSKGLWNNFVESPVYMHSLCNKFFKSALISKLSFDENLSVCEDMLFCAKAFIDSKNIKYYQLTGYCYNQQSESLTHSLNNKKKSLDDISAADSLKYYCDNSSQDGSFVRFINYRKQIAALRYLTEPDVFSPIKYRKTISSKHSFRDLPDRKHRMLCWSANYKIDIIPYFFILMKKVLKR